MFVSKVSDKYNNKLIKHIIHTIYINSDVQIQIMVLTIRQLQYFLWQQPTIICQYQ